MRRNDRLPSWLDLLFWVACAAVASTYGGCTLWGPFSK